VRIGRIVGPDVEADDRHAGRSEVLEQARMVTPRQRPRGIELLQRRVVDADDGDRQVHLVRRAVHHQQVEEPQLDLAPQRRRRHRPRQQCRPEPGPQRRGQAQAQKR
jgi:hypothetical protein